MLRFMPQPGSLLDRVATSILANLLWLGLAMLIIPLPAATAGLFAVLAPWVRGRDTELFAAFFGAMRRQWLKSSVIFLADTILAVVLVMNFRVLNLMNLEPILLWLIRSVNIFVAIAALMLNIYIWPLLALFDLPLRRLIGLSFRFTLVHTFWSFFILVIAALPLLLGLVFPLAFIVLALFAWIALIVSWGAWRIIRKYATPEELAALDI